MTPIEDVEVDPAEALKEGAPIGSKTIEVDVPNDGSSEVVDAPQAEEPKSASEVLDIILPMREPRAQVVWMDDEKGERTEFTFVQRELSFVSKAQWFSLVGEVMDRALGGENRLSLEALFAPPEGFGQAGFSIQRMSEADTFMHALSKLIKYMPDFLEESFCIWLNVPDWQQPMMKEVFRRPASEGGIGDDDGFAMIETFIDQNWAALEDWFSGKFDALRKRIEDRRKQASPSRRSTPSSSTPHITRSA